MLNFGFFGACESFVYMARNRDAILMGKMRAGDV
jgi:hypothetical protein